MKTPKPIASLGLQLWMAKRSSDRFVRMHATGHVRRILQQQTRDHSRRGKGNRAWRRARALDNRPGVLVWPDYAL
jgi:hypothetical protein